MHFAILDLGSTEHLEIEEQATGDLGGIVALRPR